MDAMSSTMIANVFRHPKFIPTFPPNKYSTTTFPHISSSLSIHEQEPPQYPKSTTSTCTSSKRHPMSPQSPLKELMNSSVIVGTKAKSITMSLFNALNHIINFMEPPLCSSLDPKHVLSNNFAPVDELPPTECLITEGTLPPCLNGAYIRNGPNPQYHPQGPYHLLDGDGMLHSLLICNGHATLCSRYVKTYRYNIELEAGSPIFPKFFSGFNGLPTMIARTFLAVIRILCGHFNPMNGIGLASTSLAFFGDKLFALGEPDLPYQILLTQNGDIQTIGRHDFEGKLSTMSCMTAHPKIDAQTGETFAFRYSPITPFLTYFRFDANGSKHPDVPIYSMKSLAFIHDFAITKKYAIFVDIQIVMAANPIELVANGGSVVRVDPTKVPRIGVIPRYANDDSEMRWFDVPGFNIMHAINAWDEEDSIVLIAPNILSVEHTLERIELIRSSLEKVRIDLKSGMVTRSSLSTKNLDLGVINPNFMGRKNKYGYLGIGNPLPKISGIVKLDWSSEIGKEVGCRMFGNGCYGGEPFFVAKPKDPSSRAGVDEDEDEDEDEGYLVTYVHDENTGESRFLVMDAKSPTLDIVASVKLPRRVPYGFHGLFVRDSDLTKLSPSH